MTERPKFSSKKCPISAEFVRAARDAFGPDVEVVALREGGYEWDPERRLVECRAGESPT